MTEELKKQIETLEAKVESLTNKVNEVVEVLAQNELYGKVKVDYLYDAEAETEEEAEVEKPEEVKEEAKTE